MILARAGDATGSHRDSERRDIRPVITSTVHDCRFYDSFIRGKLCVNAGVPSAERFQLRLTISPGANNRNEMGGPRRRREE